jgi:hypothetical protein
MTLDEMKGPVSGNRKPQPQSWMSYSIGRSNLHLGGVMVRPKRRIRAELYISSDNAKALFGLLQDQKTEIEAELGFSLDWEKLPGKRDCRIATYLDDTDPEDRADWPRQHHWLAERLNTMHRVLQQRVRNLDPADWDASADGLIE